MAKQVMPTRNIVFTAPQNEFIAAQMDELGIGASEVVRRGMDFYIRYGIKPEIMARLISEVDREKKGQRRAEKRAA